MAGRSPMIVGGEEMTAPLKSTHHAQWQSF
jgi:hypothetical protein